MKLKAVFLDKDGALIPEISTAHNVDMAELNEPFVEALQLLQSYGYLLVIVSDQTGTNNDSQDTPEHFRNAIVSSCSRLGIYLDGFYYSDHHPKTLVADSASLQSRQEPELLLQAANDMDIDLSASWLVGDCLNKVEAAKITGCNTLLVSDDGTPVSVTDRARDIAEAARKIINRNAARRKGTSRKKEFQA